MATRRASESRGPFLGTEEIIERLREAQLTQRRQRLRKLGGAALGLAVVAVGVLVRNKLSSGQPTDAEAEAAIVARAADGDGAPAGAWAQGASSDAGPQADAAHPKVYSKASADHARDAAPAPPSIDPSVRHQVRVDVLGGPGSIYIDGARVTMGTSWVASLGQGEHAVMVRVGEHAMRYRLRVADDDLRLRFDSAANAIREEPYTPSPSP